MADHQLIRDAIRPIPDFPQPGIVFRDIAPLLRSPEAFTATLDLFAKRYRGGIDAIAGIDSRGFLFGAPLADRLKLPFIMIRKPGKLPGDVQSKSYSLEYGENSLEVQTDALPSGGKTLLIDDLIATGGSAQAAIELLESIGATVVEAAFVVELVDLGGRELLKPTKVFSILTY